jgi:hypothetical protein
MEPPNGGDLSVESLDGQADAITIENSYGELKTRLRGASFILRSRSP